MGLLDFNLSDVGGILTSAREAITLIRSYWFDTIGNPITSGACYVGSITGFRYKKSITKQYA